jgi:hypothetical protein
MAICLAELTLPHAAERNKTEGMLIGDPPYIWKM